MPLLQTVAEITGLVPPLPSAPATRVLVGIVGAPGAGKSTISEQLVHSLAPHAALLGMDGFHLSQSRLVELGRRQRMGASDTFDVDGFLAVLRDIRFGTGPVLAPGFDRAIEEAVAGEITIPAAARIVIIEGNYLLHNAEGWEAVAGMLDTSFFVSVEHDLRLSRLIARHERFGKSADAAVAWATGPDEANARLIETTAARADHIVRLH